MTTTRPTRERIVADLKAAGMAITARKPVPVRGGGSLCPRCGTRVKAKMSGVECPAAGCGWWHCA